MTYILDEAVAAEIDEIAERRFQDHFVRRREKPFVPLPIESMVKFDLRFSLVFMELRTVVRSFDSLGFLCMPYRLVVVDEGLNPWEFPENQGRYRFTVAHEIGHLCLHRHELGGNDDWLKRDPAREIIREKEANRFAGALMMPKSLLRPAWREAFGLRTICREDLMPSRDELIDNEIARRQFCPEGDEAMDRLMFDGAVSGLANQFGVSPWAMRIRCEQLGLIVR